MDPKFIRALERVTVGILKPDLTFVLDVPADIGLRAPASGEAKTAADRFEDRVRLPCIRSCGRHIGCSSLPEPARCILIDATEPKSVVADRIWKTRERTSVSGDGSDSAHRSRIVSELRETDRSFEPHCRGKPACFTVMPRPRRRCSSLSQRSLCACLVADRSGRHRQSNPGLSPGAVLLAHPDPSLLLSQATSLQVDAEHPVARRVAAQAHGDLLVLERTVNEKPISSAKISKSTTCEGRSRFSGRHRRRAGGGLLSSMPWTSSTARAPMRSSKILEEPPQQALLLLVSHSVGRVLPTIRSRCRLLSLRPLPAADVGVPRLPQLDEIQMMRRSRPQQRLRKAACGALWRFSIMRTRLATLISDLLGRLPALDPWRSTRSAIAFPAQSRRRLQPLSNA